MGKCDETRPKDREGEKKVERKAFQLDDIGEMPVSVTVYPGCIEGDRLTYSVFGKDRAVLAFGTALQVAQYTVGDKVTLEGKAIPKGFHGEYQRNIGRRDTEAATRINDEMKGTGEVEALRVKQQGQYQGFTLAVNGEKVTPESILNSYFKSMTFVMAEVEKEGKKQPVKQLLPTDQLTDQHKPILKEGKPVQTMGGVELVVSAMIVPGSNYSASSALPGTGYGK